MKKFTAMLLCLLLIACLSTAALADSAEAEMVPVLAQVPADWAGPCCWAWADDGTNAFAAWPGGAMEPLGDSGWYYIYVPAFVQNVIISANEAAVQTAGDVVEAGREVWIAVADDLTTTVSYEAQADVEIPAYVETYTVHAYVPLEWESVSVLAGEAEKAMSGGEEGWFTADVPVTATSLTFIGNGGAAQTEAVAVEPQEAWVTVYNDLSTEAVYEDPEAPDAPPITVHAQVPADWAGPCCWAWSAPDGTNAFAAWPGEAMSGGEAGWFTAEAPAWVNSIIVSGNEGEAQTEDIAIEAQEVWVTVYNDLTYEVAYEDPEQADVPDITIHAQVPADWAEPCCWAWSAPDGTNAYAAWPGEPMAEEDGWYTVQAPGWINSVIINGNEGSVQTADLSVESGVDVWVVVTDAENASVTYEAP